MSLDARGNLIRKARSDGTSIGADERVRVVTMAASGPASGPVVTRVYVDHLDHRIIGAYGPGDKGDEPAVYSWALPEDGDRYSGGT